jgi:Skp family chaperone for outer membrane proteins
MKFTTAVYALTIAALVAANAHGEPMTEAVIAVIDYQKIERESIAAQTLMEQVDDFRAVYQADITKQEDTLRAEREELERQQTILSAESFNEKRRAFETKYQELQRQVMDRTRILDRALAAARDEILRTVLVITGEFGADLGFNIVLEKSQTFFFRNSMSITDAVLMELNQRLPVVAASVPKPE